MKSINVWENESFFNFEVKIKKVTLEDINDIVSGCEFIFFEDEEYKTQLTLSYSEDETLLTRAISWGNLPIFKKIEKLKYDFQETVFVFDWFTIDLFEEELDEEDIIGLNKSNYYIAKYLLVNYVLMEFKRQSYEEGFSGILESYVESISRIEVREDDNYIYFTLELDK